MSIIQVLTSANARLGEVQKLLAHIKKLEDTAEKEKDPVSAENATILRGLFFVHLYGAFENSIALSVQVLLQEITKVGVSYSHFEHLLHVVALDPDFRSVADAGWQSKWSKRRELLQKQLSHTSCALNDTLFHDQIENVWYATLSNIFEYLCIPVPAVPDNRMRGYIDEIVNNRNAVAHGRLSPQTVGRLTTSAELAKRLDAITEVINHVVTSFDSYLTNREFVAIPHRPHYVSPTAVDPA
jgi:hypothetical protein